MNSVSSSALLGAAFIVWAGIHTALASKTVKHRVREMFGPSTRRWYRLAFVIFAVISLLPIALIHFLTDDRFLYRVPPPWRWTMLAGQVGCLIALAVSLQQAGLSYFLGSAQLTGHDKESAPDLQVRGLYRYVRHPLYLFSSLLMFLTPAMTLHLLVLYSLGTLYFVAGSVHEEALLEDMFGDAYRAYREQVPKFIPWPGRYYRSGQPFQRDPQDSRAQ